MDILCCQVSCIKKPYMKFPADAWASCRGRPAGNEVHRIAGSSRQNPSRQALYYTVQWQQLCPYGRGTKRWMDAFVWRFVAAVRELISHWQRRRDRPSLCGWAEFNCGLWFDWKFLLLLLHSALKPLSLKNRALRGAWALRPLDCFSMSRHIFQLCTQGKGIRGLIPT